MGEWIDVKDELPDKDGDYLCWVIDNCDGCQDYDVVAFMDGRFGITSNPGFKVTHWMPLPDEIHITNRITKREYGKVYVEGFDYDTAFEKLADYEDDEEERKILRSPVSVGRHIFVINDNEKINRYKVIGFGEDESGIDCFILQKRKNAKIGKRFVLLPIDYWGVRGFETYDEAERKLKELLEEDH